MTTGLHETRLAAETVAKNSEPDELHRHLETAIAWLTKARQALDP